MKCQKPAKLGGAKFTDKNGESLKKEGSSDEVKENDKVETEDLKNVTGIDLTGFEGEIKGLEYFTGLTKFDDTNKAVATKITNKTLDFSANSSLTEIKVTQAPDLAEIVLPEAFVNEDKKEEYKLETLTLNTTELANLDLSKQAGLKTLTVTASKLKALDLSTLKLNDVTLTGNHNLAEVTLNNGKPGSRKTLTSLDLSDNALETVNLDYINVTGALNLSNNHIGALDLRKTKVDGTPTLTGQTFYISDKFGSVNLAETFENFDAEKVKSPAAEKFNKETGVLTLEPTLSTEYTYEVNLDGKTSDLTVKLTKANPMNRLYNPNSGEHFYTADLEEKDILVKLGWKDEGYGWVAPSKDDSNTKDKDAFRLYNPNAGDHHYTTSPDEVKTLVAYGWKDEGTGWYSAKGDKTVSVYRQYNPYANGAGSHNYTTNKAENDYLVSLGWIYEGAGWEALR